ncbi:MAG TPA: 50S ribosomal protein L18 [Planctomycetes bacterium]|nr:50S ribosomal protein L18 [Planctomycetota bacterium]HIN80074.1 50S ribosomal protein L18 [Planctomycetota bacterium]
MDRNVKKNIRRVRRRKHIRKRLEGNSERPRLTVFRSRTNIYCQAIDDLQGVTLASASTLCAEIRDQVGKNAGNVQGAEMIGQLMAARMKEKGLTRASFDRNGYKFHGRVKAVAEALRKEGIEV